MKSISFAHPFSACQKLSVDIYSKEKRRKNRNIILLQKESTKESQFYLACSVFAIWINRNFLHFTFDNKKKRQQQKPYVSVVHCVILNHFGGIKINTSNPNTTTTAKRRRRFLRTLCVCVCVWIWVLVSVCICVLVWKRIFFIERATMR